MIIVIIIISIINIIIIICFFESEDLKIFFESILKKINDILYHILGSSNVF